MQYRVTSLISLPEKKLALNDIVDSDLFTEYQLDRLVGNGALVPVVDEDTAEDLAEHLIEEGNGEESSTEYSDPDPDFDPDADDSKEIGDD